MHALAEGARLRVSDPLQNFPLGVGAARYVLVAGGIGVTALVAMATALRRRGADYSLVLVGRSRSVMAYLDDLTAEHGDRVRLHVDDEGTGLDVGGLVDDVASSDACGRHRAVHVWPDPADGRRPPRVGRPRAARRPTCASRPSATAAPGLRSSSASPSRALDREVVVGEDVSMLDALEDAGVEVMWDCRKGECGLCTVRVLELRRPDRPPRRVPQRRAEAARHLPVLLRVPRRRGDRAGRVGRVPHPGHRRSREASAGKRRTTALT